MTERDGPSGSETTEAAQPTVSSPGESIAAAPTTSGAEAPQAGSHASSIDAPKATPAPSGDLYTRGGTDAPRTTQPSTRAGSTDAPRSSTRPTTRLVPGNANWFPPVSRRAAPPAKVIPPVRYKVDKEAPPDAVKYLRGKPKYGLIPEVKYPVDKTSAEIEREKQVGRGTNPPSARGRTRGRGGRG